MVLVPVGESAVSISINGTERVNELISDDTSYNLTESQNVTVNVNGSQRVSDTITSDQTYNINESFGLTVNQNGSQDLSTQISSDTTLTVNNITINDYYEYNQEYDFPDEYWEIINNQPASNIVKIDYNLTVVDDNGDEVTDGKAELTEDGDVIASGNTSGTYTNIKDNAQYELILNPNYVNVFTSGDLETFVRADINVS